MKIYTLLLTPLIVCLVLISSCKKDKNNNRITIHENLYPRMVVKINVDSITNAELDTAGIINYYKQSDAFDYDSIGFWSNSIHTFMVFKVVKDAYGSGSFDLAADSSYNTIPFFYLFSHIGAAKFINNNVSNLFLNYGDCDFPGSFGYETNFDFHFNALNRMSSYSYVTHSTRCATNGITDTQTSYDFSSDEDTCYITYNGSYFGCQDKDTIIYYNDHHRSKIPYLAYTYSGYSYCSLRFSSGTDIFPYSDYQYKLIKQVRTAFWNTSTTYIQPYILTYTYRFDADDNVQEVLVKVSDHLGGFLKDYKLKFYY